MDKIIITSISQYATKITIVENKKFIQENKHLAVGHVEIFSPKQFILSPKSSKDIEFKVSLGLRQHFFESIGLEINNNTTAIPIHFRGSGVFPMIIPIELNRIPEASIFDITESYFHLRDLFNETLRKSNQLYVSISKNESAPPVIKRDKLNELNKNTRKNTLKRNKTRDFVLLNYSEEKYPRVEDIERFVEIERFLFNLLKSNKLRAKYEKFHSKCFHLRAMEFDTIINLKFTICRPIPWKCSAFNFDMGAIKLNETKHFETAMTFIGPERLFLSLRTEITIPGLTACFEASQKHGFSDLFVFFVQPPDVKTLKRYKNISERSSDTENNHIQDTEVNILHSHSYDFDEKGVHQRKKLPNEIKQIKERYKKISQKMKETKNPLILTEICQTTEEDLSDLILKLNLKLTATKEFYKIDQVIEDYLFIDIHLGPTVPILLRGKIFPA